jgi:hypothetical protein
VLTCDKRRSTVIRTLLLAIACHAGAFASDPTTRATDRAEPLALPPMSLTDFGPRDSEVQTVGQHGDALPEEYECRVSWDNGSYDGVNALNSQELYHNGNLIYSAVVADDFFLQFGKCYVIDSIEVEIAAAYIPLATPDVRLRIFEDCNGKPAAAAAGFNEYQSVEITDLGPVTGWPGFTRYRIRYEINLFEYGYRRLWIAPVGQGQGLYYWLTSNSGTIQGAQGQYKAPQNGFPNWTDTDDIEQECPTNDCWDHCTDFAFRICGKCCWLLKDNSQYDLNGLSSIAFANNAIFGTRAVDNFEVPPGEPLELCRIEAWMATNCGEAFMEIYDNLCDSPVGSPIVLSKPDREALPGVTYDGLQVYRYSFTCPEVELAPGRNYWLSMAALGVGTPHERAIWLFRQKSACHICITEGQWRSFFLGFPEFTPVSNPALAGEPRDFAFRIYAAERPAPPPPPLEPLARFLAVDFDLEATDRREGTRISAYIDNVCFSPGGATAPYLEGPDPVFDNFPDGAEFHEFDETMLRYGACTTGGDAGAPFAIESNPFQGAPGSYALVQGQITQEVASAGQSSPHRLEIRWFARASNGFPPTPVSNFFSTFVYFVAANSVTAEVAPGYPAGLVLRDSNLNIVNLASGMIQLNAGEVYCIGYSPVTANGTFAIEAQTPIAFTELCPSLNLADQLKDFTNMVDLNDYYPATEPALRGGARPSFDGGVEITRVEPGVIRIGGTTDGGMDDPTDDEVENNSFSDAFGSYGLMNGRITRSAEPTLIQWRWFGKVSSINESYDFSNDCYFELIVPEPRGVAMLAIQPRNFNYGVELCYDPTDAFGDEEYIDLSPYGGLNPSAEPILVQPGRYRLKWSFGAAFDLEVLEAPESE